MNTTGSTLTHLQYSKCDIEYSKDSIHGLSPCCSLPLFPKYDVDKAKTVFKQNDLIDRPPNMWRYKEMMPIHYQDNITTLGEGYTPLGKAGPLGKKLGFNNRII